MSSSSSRNFLAELFDSARKIWLVKGVYKVPGPLFPSQAMIIEVSSFCKLTNQVKSKKWYICGGKKPIKVEGSKYDGRNMS